MNADKLPTERILAANNKISVILDYQPFFDAAKDLAPNANGGSFYIVSYLESDRHKFTVMFHLMLIVKVLPQPLAQLAISVFDEKTNQYFSKETNHLLAVAPQGLDIALPGGHLSGTIEQLTVQGQISKGRKQFGMDLEMKPRGPVLPNLVTGVIPFSDGVDYEYALPSMETSGTIEVCGTQYTVKGRSWLDREWGLLGPSKWTWMNIQLENGVQMSIWDEQTDDKRPGSYVGGSRRFATIMEQNGGIIVAAVEIEELSHWTSRDTNQTYANKWCVTIPDRAKLNVALLYDEQEIVSEVRANRVEGKARVSGTYGSKQTTGVTMVEMFDLFPFFRK